MEALDQCFDQLSFAIQTLLQRKMQLERNNPQVVANSTPSLAPVVQTSSDAGEIKRLSGYAQAPKRYGGDPDACCGFLNQLGIYLEMIPCAFPSERSKVGFLISLLMGRLLAWTNPLWESDKPVVYIFMEFVKCFKRVFDRPGSMVSASKHLMTIHQGAHTVANYSIKFPDCGRRLE
ncbi:protein LDOC1-like [Rhinophrynus dorsalis]